MAGVLLTNGLNPPPPQFLGLNEETLVVAVSRNEDRTVVEYSTKTAFSILNASMDGFNMPV